MLAPIKLLLVVFGILLVMLFSTGILAVKKDGYACAGGWQTGFHEREEIFHYGSLHLYAVPFKRECPLERRYDPDDVQSCINTGFCTITEDPTVSDL